jgi:hypothetical protein
MLIGLQSRWTMLRECQDEMIDFVAMRSAKDSVAVQDALGCRNFSEVLAVQSRWAAEAVRDYGAEASRILALLTRYGPGRSGQGLPPADEPERPVPGLLFH